MAELKKNNIEINTWTVNKEEDINDLIDKKVDILIGNYPDLVKKIINKKIGGRFYGKFGIIFNHYK